MSMTGELYRVTPLRLEELLADPSTIEEELLPDDYPANRYRSGCSVEKTWNAIEFILDRLISDESIRWVNPLTGGSTTGALLHYGPVWYRTPDEVMSIAQTLSAISKVQFRGGYLPELMAQMNVYPAEIWTRPNEEQNFDYVWEWYCRLVRFYQEAAEVGDAILLYLG